jgi:hypothetical protein
MPKYLVFCCENEITVNNFPQMQLLRYLPNLALFDRHSHMLIAGINDPVSPDSLAIDNGAAWIWNLVGEHFYTSHQIGDWDHVTQHLAEAARSIYGND